MEPEKKDERYFSVKIMRTLSFSQQLHEANTLICAEAAKGESVFLEKLQTSNGHIVLLYRLCAGTACKK
jgi:predicted ATPase